MRIIVLLGLVSSSLLADAQGLAVSNGPAGPAPVLAGPGLPQPAIAPVGYQPDDKYKLRPGDKVNFQIVEDREPVKMLTVTDSGELEVYPFGHLVATNKTCKQVVVEMKTLLSPYYRSNTLILALETANKENGRVYVVGQVRAQGALPMVVGENLTAARAVMRAGGYGDYAKTKQVKVWRPSKTPGGPTQEFNVNLDEIFEKGKLEKDILLEPDDVVFVPQKVLSF